MKGAQVVWDSLNNLYVTSKSVTGDDYCLPVPTTALCLSSWTITRTLQENTPLPLIS